MSFLPLRPTAALSFLPVGPGHLCYRHTQNVNEIWSTRVFFAGHFIRWTLLALEFFFYYYFFKDVFISLSAISVQAGLELDGQSHCDAAIGLEIILKLWTKLGSATSRVSCSLWVRMCCGARGWQWLEHVEQVWLSNYCSRLERQGNFNLFVKEYVLCSLMYLQSAAAVFLQPNLAVSAGETIECFCFGISLLCNLKKETHFFSAANGPVRSETPQQKCIMNIFSVRLKVFSRLRLKFQWLRHKFHCHL